MENKIVNELFLMFVLAFLGFNTALYLHSMYNISVIIFFLLFVIIFNLLLKYLKIKAKILDIINFQFIKGISLFVILFISIEYIGFDDMDMSFINGGLFFIGVFYILYDNKYIKYKLVQNKKENKNNKNVSNY